MDEMDLQTRLMHAAHRFRNLRTDVFFEGISQGEFYMLEMIRKYVEQNESTEGIYVSVLAKKLNISSPAASRMLRTLEEKRYIQRDVDRDNRRNTYVYLTELGDRVRRDATEVLQNYSSRVIRNMGKESIEALLVLWNQLGDVMEEEFTKTRKGELK